jgi:hypothetical protein
MESSEEEEEEVLAIFPTKKTFSDPALLAEVDVVIEVIRPEIVESILKKHVKYTVSGQD